MVDIDESHHAGEEPQQLVRRLALEKALAGYECHPDKPALGSDTLVIYQQHILGKPENYLQYCKMLNMLSGSKHQVMTAVAITDGETQCCEVSISEVEFSELSAQQIDAYWDTGEPLDKAGGYGIQGLAAIFIKNISGSYSGIMGLPLFETSQMLKKFSINGIE